MRTLWRTWMDKKRQRLLRDNAFSAVSRYEPPKVEAIRRKKGEAAAQRVKVAIALSEARKQGVKT